MPHYKVWGQSIPAALKYKLHATPLGTHVRLMYSDCEDLHYAIRQVAVEYPTLIGWKQRHTKVIFVQDIEDTQKVFRLSIKPLKEYPHEVVETMVKEVNNVKV